MKKLLAVISSLAMATFSSSSVVSCVKNYDYDSIFASDESEAGNQNNGEYVESGPTKAISTLKRLIRKPVEVDLKLRDTIITKIDDETLVEFVDQEKETVLKDLTSSFIEQSSLSSEDYKLTISQDNTFEVPKLIGFENNKPITRDVTIQYGTGTIVLSYLNKTVYEAPFEWYIPEYVTISEMANILNLNSYRKVGLNQAQKVDLPILDMTSMGLPMKITFGTMATIIDLLKLANSTGLIGDLGNVIEKFRNLNVDSIAYADPNNVFGEWAYANFDNAFRSCMQELINGVVEVMNNFGMSTVMTIPATETSPEIVIDISKILEINILDFLPMQIDGLEIDQDMSPITAHIKVNLGSHGEAGKLRFIDVASNMAPNLVLLFNKLLDEDSYDPEVGGNNNMLFQLLGLLIGDMDPRLLLINDKNNKNNMSATSARSGLDSLLFNTLLDYNKNRRTDGSLNIYVHVKVDIDVPVIGTYNILDDNLYSIFNKIRINPGDIVLKIINRLFDLEGEPYLDLDKPFLSPNLNLVFLTESDVNLGLIIDESSIPGGISDVVKGYDSSIKASLVNPINEQINAALPTVSLQTLINAMPNLLIKELGVDDKFLQTGSVEIIKAHFKFQFYDINEGSWVDMVRGINTKSFINYSSMKIKFTDVQFQVTVNTEKNGTWIYYSADDITFDIIFSSDDK